MGKNDKGKDKSKKGSEEHTTVIQDERFASVHNDPRFKLPNLKNFKVKVDERFSKKELKKLNSRAGSKKTKIDRYGRKIGPESKSDLGKFYEHEDEAKEYKNSDDDSEKESSDEDSSLEDGEDDDDEQGKEVEVKKGDVKVVDGRKQFIDRARGEGLSDSSSESDSDSNSDSKSESSSDEDSSESEEESEIEIEDSKPEEGDPTDSFAVVNMDWDNLRAVDLMATFSSFIPTSGVIKSISIYPSEFGKEQMQKEETEGPPREIFAKKKRKDEEDSDSESDLDLENKEDLEKAARKLYEEDDGEDDYDSKALRRYQLQRLRYYYAVVRCDSVSTAKNIYDNCDGTEYESTSNIFDLRYIPEDMQFEDEPVDICKKIPSNYKPNGTFVTDALQHSKVKLTWDETPKERQTFASRKFSQKEIEEMDFKAYLASDSEESEKDDDSNKDKYKNLLAGGFSFGGKDNDDDVDMEITFNPIMGGDNAAAEEEKEETEETTIEAYRRKEKDRRKKRLAKFKEKTQDGAEDKAEPTDSTAQKTNSKKGAKGKKSSEVDALQKAQLELITMDEDQQPQPDHFNMRDIIKAEKQKKNKRKNKKSAAPPPDLTQDSFTPDLNDPRFKELFENHEYAIDPTSSEFKKTQTMDKILNERSKRARSGDSSRSKSKKPKKEKPESSSDLSQLVSKLKSKGNSSV